LSLFFSVYVNRRRPANCTARIALVAAKIPLVATKILLVAMPRRDQWKKNSVGRNKNSVGRNKNSVGRDEGRCSGWQFGDDKVYGLKSFKRRRYTKNNIEYQYIIFVLCTFVPKFAKSPYVRAQNEKMVHPLNGVIK
jgi:hypothetical protein